MHVPNLSYLGDIKTALHSYQAGLDLPYLIERVGQRRKKDGAIDVGSRIPLRLESLSHKRQAVLDGASLSDKRTAHEEFAERAEGRKSVFLREGLQLARLWGHGRVIATKRFTNQGEIGCLPPVSPAVQLVRSYGILAKRDRCGHRRRLG